MKSPAPETILSSFPGGSIFQGNLCENREKSRIAIPPCDHIKVVKLFLVALKYLRSKLSLSYMMERNVLSISTEV
ncbi:hypothetical protein PsorP6_003585 [Peronosclerospora sorghi]|uniref:Uncharacterized protein n=1 Tax=Peronosclerospora sorghi TaxID=230839 RepID=A0ACC0VLR6_9STRA|nr:hypothetical protein PsorP6_003585 [Peronosclerospora sorghi]